MGEIRRGRGEIAWLEPPANWFRNAICAISLRYGGVSPSPYATLNLGRSAGDAPEHVAANEERLRAAIAMPGDPARAFLAHGAECAVVQAPGIVRGVDGLATGAGALPLWLTVADCHPVFLEAGDWVGLLHCGWKGTAAGAIGVLVRLLEERAGAPAREMRAWIGPGIGRCCYPVGEEVAARFPPDCVERRAGRTRLDLGKAVRDGLIGAGLRPEWCDRSEICTSCNPESLFSYRRDGSRSGRMAAVIWLPRKEGQLRTDS